MPPDPICPIYDDAVAGGNPVVFDHSLIAHLDYYIAAEGALTLVRSFLVSRPSERFCHTCLAQHLTRNRQEIEKAATGLQLTRSVSVDPFFDGDTRRGAYANEPFGYLIRGLVKHHLGHHHSVVLTTGSSLAMSAKVGQVPCALIGA